MVCLGQILGHIVSKNGISIDFEKIKVMSFLGQRMQSKAKDLWDIVDIMKDLSTCMS